MNVTEANKHQVLTGVYTTVFLMGLPLNAVSLWILLRHGLRSSNTVVMANLVVSDLLLILSLPLRIYYYATLQWSFGDLVCTVVTLLFRINIISSSFFITFISVDRLLAVEYPLRSRGLRTPRNAWVACTGVWLTLLALAVLIGLQHNQEVKSNSNFTCFEINRSQEEHTVDWVPLFLVICLLVLLIVNVVSTAIITRRLCKHQAGSQIHNIRKIMVIFVMNLLMFALFFIPFIVVIVFASLDMLPNLKVVELTVCYTAFNCCLDPLIYYFSIVTCERRDVDLSVTRGQVTDCDL